MPTGWQLGDPHEEYSPSNQVTKPSLGSGNFDRRTICSFPGCLRLLWASRYRHDVHIGESVASRKMASQGREHDRRPLFGLALRKKQAIDLCRHEVRGKRHSLQ